METRTPRPCSKSTNYTTQPSSSAQNTSKAKPPSCTNTVNSEVAAPKRKAAKAAKTTKAIIKKIKYVTKKTTLPLCRGNGEHFPEAYDGWDECWLCRFKMKTNSDGSGGRGPKTQWRCMTCELPLCLVATRNCFTEFHLL